MQDATIDPHFADEALMSPPNPTHALPSEVAGLYQELCERAGYAMDG